MRLPTGRSGVVSRWTTGHPDLVSVVIAWPLSVSMTVSGTSAHSSLGHDRSPSGLLEARQHGAPEQVQAPPPDARVETAHQWLHRQFGVVGQAPSPARRTRPASRRRTCRSPSGRRCRRPGRTAWRRRPAPTPTRRSSSRCRGRAVRRSPSPVRDRRSRRGTAVRVPRMAGAAPPARGAGAPPRRSATGRAWPAGSCRRSGRRGAPRPRAEPPMYKGGRGFCTGVGRITTVVPRNSNGSPVQALSRDSMISSRIGTRRALGTPNISYSCGRYPRPSVTSTRPSLMRSSTARSSASRSGWWSTAISAEKWRRI